MKTMIIDASSNILYISFFDKGKEIYNVERLGKNDHSDHLINLIQVGLRNNNLEISDFEQIIVGNGPGSYTGLRLALSVAKMFAWTSNIKLLTISSLDILSSGARIKDGVYITALKAKRGFVYANVIKVTAGKEERLVDDIYISDIEFLELKNKYQDAIVVHDEYYFNANNIIKSMFLEEQAEVHLVVPNYLREAL